MKRKLSETDARQGRITGYMPRVLALSAVLAIVALLIVFLLLR